MIPGGDLKRIACPFVFALEFFTKDSKLCFHGPPLKLVANPCTASCT